MSRDNLNDVELGFFAPFAPLDLAEIRRAVEVSRKLALPGARYTTASLDPNSNVRWRVTRFRGGEELPSVEDAEWPAEELDRDDPDR